MSARRETNDIFKERVDYSNVFTKFRAVRKFICLVIQKTTNEIRIKVFSLLKLTQEPTNDHLLRVHLVLQLLEACLRPDHEFVQFVHEECPVKVSDLQIESLRSHSTEAGHTLTLSEVWHESGDR